LVTVGDWADRAGSAAAGGFRAGALEDGGDGGEWRPAS